MKQKSFFRTTALLVAFLACAGVVTAQSRHLPGVFSVSATKKVHFSSGNLQYQASSGTWRFAEQQYNFVGDATNGNVYVGSDKCNNAQISTNYSGWIDLFGWGTGNNPVLALTTDASYADFNDWGAVIATNQFGLGWTVLSSDEWTYLMTTRTDADVLKTRATVNNQIGTIVLPDEWTLPTGVPMTCTAADYTTNNYNAAQWTTLEEAGAVFLPACGYRDGTTVSYKGTPYTFAYYWTSTIGSDASRAKAVQLHRDDYLLVSSYRHNGYAVRLVCENPSFAITANQDPDNPDNYYSTFYHSRSGFVLPAGVEAYIAEVNGEELVLTRIAEENEVLPADNAVILKSCVPSYVLAASDGQPVSFSAANSLRGVDEQTALASLSLTRATCYVLSGTAEYGVGFYRCNSDFLKPHKAYVSYQGSGQQNAPRRMRFVFNDNQSATGIGNMDQEPIVNSRKLIKNGQLVIIRNGMEYNAAGQLVK